jgi:rfaE bifunctional protein nucleotidyltransferase chain/domain
MGEVRAQGRPRKSRRDVVFTNGCFDILVAQHVRLLQHAASLGLLCVSVNGDASVARIKGAGRPIMPIDDRLEIVSAIVPDAHVFANDDDSPLDAITLLRPEILVKGAEWPEDKIIGAVEVKKGWGNPGRVVRVAAEPRELHSSDVVTLCFNLINSCRAKELAHK